MSIEFLRALSSCHAPLTLTRPADINDLLVLRAAGLVVALTLKPEVGGPEVGRFLALTPDGRSALGAAAAAAAPARGAEAASP